MEENIKINKKKRKFRGQDKLKGSCFCIAVSNFGPRYYIYIYIR